MELNEKAVSKKQQRFFGMVRAAQKGEGAASPEVAKVAGEISKKDAKDFAKTKHKGLPEKKEVKEEDNYSTRDKELKKTSKPRSQRYKALHSPTNKSGNVDVNEGVMDVVRRYGKKKKEERKPQKAMDAGARLRRKKQRQEYAAKVSGSEDLVPDNIRDHKTWDDFKNNLSI